MIKLWKKEDLNLLSEYPKEVVENVDNSINTVSYTHLDVYKRQHQNVAGTLD